MNIQRKVLPILISSATLSLASCSTKTETEELLQTSCANYVAPVEIISTSDEPTLTGSVGDAAALSAAITFDDTKRFEGAIVKPDNIPNTRRFKVSERLIVTDRSVTELSLTPVDANGLTCSQLIAQAGGDGLTDEQKDQACEPAIPSNARIGAIFFKVAGTNEYFAIPVKANANQTALANAQAELDRTVASLNDWPAHAESYANNLIYAANQRIVDKSATVIFRGPNIAEGAIDEARMSNSFTAGTEIFAYMMYDGEPEPDFYSTQTLSDHFNADRWFKPANTTELATYRVGTGAFNVSLIWNTGVSEDASTGGNVDIDLWLWEPESTGGEKIYYANRNSSNTNGQLDFDNVNGFGPENIFYDVNGNVPVGTYNVEVDYFAGSPTTDYTVVMNICSDVVVKSGTFNVVNGQLLDDRTHHIATIDIPENCQVLRGPANPIIPHEPNVFEQAEACESLGL